VGDAAGLPESERLVQLRPERDHTLGVRVAAVLEKLPLLVRVKKIPPAVDALGRAQVPKYLLEAVGISIGSRRRFIEIVQEPVEFPEECPEVFGLP
jgi:hypothetical protein